MFRSKNSITKSWYTLLEVFLHDFLPYARCTWFGGGGICLEGSRCVANRHVTADGELGSQS